MNNIRALVACMPKSGSTYLSSAIEALPGIIRAHLVPGYGHREQELCIEKLCEYEELLKGVFSGGYVAQHHVRYSEVTQYYMARFSVRPIVLVRNIFDVVVSLVDHHARLSNVYPAAFAPDDIAFRSFDEQVMFVTQMAIPWYFNFYTSWQKCPDKVLITYEDFIACPELVLGRICKHLCFSVTEQNIVDAVRMAGTSSLRKNKVAPGRGKSLPRECIESIEKMASYYRDVDFGPIGIPNECRK